MTRLGFYHPAFEGDLPPDYPPAPGGVQQLAPPNELPAERSAFDRALDLANFAAAFVRDVGIGVGILVIAWRWRQ